MTNFMSAPNILWKVENFPSTYKETSPVIKFMGLKFHLSFFHFMQVGSTTAKLQVILEFLNCFEPSETRIFNIDASIQHTNGSRVLTKTGKYDSTRRQWCIWIDFVSTISKTFGVIKDLTFSIIITPTGDFGSIFSTDESVEGNDCESFNTETLTTDFGNLFNNDEYSDFTIKCGEKHFQVHKAVLSVRSSFFAAMFRSDMKESNEGCVKIEDLEPDILELVLCYLYTGQIPKLCMESLRKVYATADRFGMEFLKMKCFYLIIESLIRPDKNDVKAMEKETPKACKQTEKEEAETYETQEKELLKELLESREWRKFCCKFPNKAQEMCRPYLLY